MRLLFLLFITSVSLNLNAQSYKSEIKDFREEYKAKFLEEERSPLKEKKDIAKIKFFKPNEKYRVECRFLKEKEPNPFDMATYSGEVRKYQKYGTLYFRLDGKNQELSVYQSLKLMDSEEHKDYLFIPFKDGTTKEDLTYEGGRYMDMEISDFETEFVTIDFNKCYNPWCAYADGYSCPVPPKENKLRVSIFAGEKLYAGSVKRD